MKWIEAMDRPELIIHLNFPIIQVFYSQISFLLFKSRSPIIQKTDIRWHEKQQLKWNYMFNKLKKHVYHCSTMWVRDFGSSYQLSIIVLKHQWGLYIVL